MDIFGNTNKKIGKINSDLSEYSHPVELEPKDVLEEDKEKPGFIFWQVLLIILGIVLLFRLLDLQITQGAKFQNLAEGNRIRSRLIEAPRGIVYDHQGVDLVRNDASFNLELTPADLPREKADREKVYLMLSPLGINSPELMAKVEKAGLYSLDPIVLKENLAREETLLFKMKFSNISGIQVASHPRREYKENIDLSPILGYIGKVTDKDLINHPDYGLSDRIGKSGLEYTYNNNLKGKDGQEQVEVNAKGQIQRVLATLEPTSGNNLFLSLDYGLQEKLAISLLDMVKAKNSSAGVAIAMNPQNGEILSMASVPTYDNNLFSKGLKQEDYQKLLDDPNKPLLNRAIAGRYPSGSTIKPMVAAAGLQEGVINEKTTINDPGEIKIGEWSFPDWKAHGLVDVKKAIAESCNVFFYSVGGGWDKIKGLGIKKLKEYLEHFGFGKKTGIDLDGEQEGFVPDPAWKKKVKKEPWYIGDTYHLSIGQGDISVTPLQLINAISAISNGGELLKPHLVTKVTDDSGKELKSFSKEVLVKDFISHDNIEIVRQGMRQTVTSGSARTLAPLVDKNGKTVEAAAKTGTAQFGDEGKTHAWFVTFAPYDNPEIAVLVLIEGGGEGYASALPVARDGLQYWFNK